VQHNAADELHVEVAHAEGAFGGLPHHGEGLGQELVERGLLGCPHFRGLLDAFGALLDELPEGVGLRPEPGVGERGNFRFEPVDRIDAPLDALQVALVLGAEDLLEDRSYHETPNSACREVPAMIITFPCEFKGNMAGTRQCRRRTSSWRGRYRQSGPGNTLI